MKEGRTIEDEHSRSQRESGENAHDTSHSDNLLISRKFDRRFISFYFFKDVRSQKIGFEKPLILLSEKNISLLQDILPSLDASCPNSSASLRHRRRRRLQGPRGLYPPHASWSTSSRRDQSSRVRRQPQVHPRPSPYIDTRNRVHR